MRTNVDIDDELIREAMETSGLPTKKAAIEAALKEMIRRHSQRQALDELWGIGWDGDLDVMRDARGFSPTAQHAEFRTVTP
ncbi:type II toxin-antitoxin system VapB family antitoxin [Rhizobium sp. LjRoot30]